MKRKSSVIVFMAFIAIALVVSSCKKDDPAPPQTVYALGVKDVLGVSGTATFIQTSKTSVTIDIVLKGAPLGTHPVELCMNSAVEDGAVAKTLSPVDATGKSSTLLEDMTYQELLVYDGCIKVYETSKASKQLLAIGDIGGNVLTATKKSYELKKVGTFGVSGTALFEKRTNGNTLVTISLSGTISGESYPASINIGTIGSVGGGPVTRTLSPINGATGKSYTNIRELDDKIVITYDNWLAYGGYINIYQNAPLYNNIICQGDIGANVKAVK